MPLAINERRCLACGEFLPPGTNAGRKYCHEVCDHRRRPAPAVYRYICPDGRSYVGRTGNHRIRDRHGLSRSKPWIDEAIVTRPLETWAFEVLEVLPAGCSKETLRRAEQHHIERLRAFLPEHGFNIRPASGGLEIRREYWRGGHAAPKRRERCFGERNCGGWNSRPPSATPWRRRAIRG
jgi:hypothetical protein